MLKETYLYIKILKTNVKVLNYRFLDTRECASTQNSLIYAELWNDLYAYADWAYYFT